MQQHLSLLNKHVNTVKDVPAREFISAFAQHLKQASKFKIPDWSKTVKTACFHELGPLSDDWLYARAASICYQLYMRQKVGVKGLRKHYGGKADRGVKREHTRMAAGKNIRYCLEQLMQAGIVGETKYQSEEGSTITMGKSLTKKGVMDMDRIAVAQFGKKKGGK
eukprot:Macronucleus_5812.p1 GENE.Macronucleus_5812~~Macronucleus_5812.p1  ORF type:complete len:165 (+),score=74.51 Macronucleus_5812:1-495(+)